MTTSLYYNLSFPSSAIAQEACDRLQAFMPYDFLKPNPITEVITNCVFKDIIDVVSNHGGGIGSVEQPIDFEGYNYKNLPLVLDLLLLNAINNKIPFTNIGNYISEFVVGYVAYVEWIVTTFWSELIIAVEFFVSQARISAVKIKPDWGIEFKGDPPCK